MDHHVHVAGVAAITFIAFYVLVNGLGRPFFARRADKPWAQAASFVL